MLRPLDQALIDFQKTYRQMFKEPFYEHEQYTKRQLIYSYAAIGSDYIKNFIQFDQQQKNSPLLDLDDVINKWNDPSSKILKIPPQSKSSPNQETLTYEDEEDLRILKKQIDMLKKQKTLVKYRHERKLFFRKELEVLFKAKNLGMLSVQSMRSHFQELKPYISYNNRFNRSKKDHDNDKNFKNQNELQRQNSREDYQRNNLKCKQQDQDSQKKQSQTSKQKIQKNSGYQEASMKGEQSNDLNSNKRNSYEPKQKNYLNATKQTTFLNSEQYFMTKPYLDPQFVRNQASFLKYPQPIEGNLNHNQNYHENYPSNLYQHRMAHPAHSLSTQTSFYQYEDKSSSFTSQYSTKMGLADINKLYQNQG